ncbi:hypothetical protein NUW58_g9303 [Xylaria curta]|uniref:Uncharacterized protein n=1 Tax=Xylaria curta TaxID=42375 RepID=A0ACC1MYN4_9PEZI|nr:hypothetical protein NUW58_g9303 [Xylaria curta]
MGPSHDIAYGDAIIGSRGDPAAPELPSRPSSTCTIDSHDGVERQDSPITSIDEDRGGRIRNNLRTTSGKVQELVGKFDGLARAVSEEPPAISRRAITRTPSREKSPGKSEIEDENGIDFGDFKDSSASDDNAARLPSEASFSSEPPVTPKAETKELFIRKLRHEGEEDVIKTTEAANVQHQDMANKSPGISFDTNIASVDKLFPTLTGSLASSSTEDWEATDYNFSDNFTEISERKSWYRISRYGSMRKHNSGDDENYHRVTWPTSQLHSDTIKIVRRWMEEDSYAGKATLGGTKRTGFFNWDSDAAPVQLDEVFRRKKSVSKHVRTKSIPANNAIIQAASVNERPYRNSTGISFPLQVQSANKPIAPAPSFGWNSETCKVPAPVPAPAPVQASTRHSIPIQPTLTDEDGDDWGEMVSSPRATEEHVEPTVSALPLVSIPTESHEPAPQLLPTAFHNDQPTALESPGSQNTLPTLSDPWLFSDIPVLDKPKREGEPPKGRASQTWEDSTVLETLSLPRSAPLAELGHGSSVSDKTPSENTIAGAAVVTTASSASEPSKVTEMTASAIKLPGNDNQDDVIVQKILQSLPDLSYMIR